MSKSQRDKGNRGEREVVKKFLKAGYQDARRNYADKAIPEGVDVYAGPWLLQVKRYKKSVPMSKYAEITRHDGWKALVSKVDHKPWMVTMKLDDLLAILNDIGLAWPEDDAWKPPF